MLPSQLGKIRRGSKASAVWISKEKRWNFSKNASRDGRLGETEIRQLRESITKIHIRALRSLSMLR